MTVGVGIVGSGHMARTYAQCLAVHTTGTRFAAIAGGSRAPLLAAEYSVPVEPSLDALLARSDVDAVIVATPHSLHLPQTLAAAKAGRHVYVEKPMALSVAECDAMIAACRAAGVILTVNQVSRFRSSPRTARDALLEGRIGALRTMHFTTSVPGYPHTKGWSNDPAEGGVILDMGAHVFDQVRWFGGSEVRRVFASLRDFTGPTPPHKSAMVQLELANGTPVQFWMSFEMPPPGLGSQAQVALVGSEGIIDCDNYGAVRLGIGNGWETLYVMPPFDGNRDATSPVRLAAFAEQVQDFADAIRGGRAPAVRPEESRAAVEIVEAVVRSSETGLAVELPLG
ncbi:MAG TPA: Gfo/Idh/MocA family oxidoreductase [Candidatus Saccharimonadales bacterium]|nr:Gfo/Idh/MocA family oxidoreductase [Candidatus Saccharimonadales bacterium]